MKESIITMPANVDAEKCVLGAILLDNAALHEAAVLSSADFFLEAHQRIFRRILELDSAGKNVDTVTLVDELSKTDAIQTVGGAAYISSLMDGLPRRPS